MEHIEITPDFINIERVISNKNPKLLKVIPRFIISYLKRILHVDQLNSAIYRNRDKMGVDFSVKILEEFGCKIIIRGAENIPLNERVIIASNHPLGGVDGMALMQAVGSVRKDIVFPVNDLLLNLPNLRVVFIPVNKHGSNASNIKLFNDAFESDKAVLYFPAGMCSRKINGVIQDLEWKKTIITKAKQYQRNIIPCYIDGKNTNFFYNLSNFRKRLGIKANIEMLYLVDEMYKQNGQTITITFGKPISFNTFDKTKHDKEWAEYIKQKAYELK